MRVCGICGGRNDGGPSDEWCYACDQIDVEPLDDVNCGTFQPAPPRPPCAKCGGRMTRLAKEPYCEDCPSEVERLEVRVMELESIARDSKRAHEMDDGLPLCSSFDDAPCDCGADEWNARVDAALGKAQP